MRDRGIFVSLLLILICALIFIAGCSSSDSGGVSSPTYSLSGTVTLDGSALQGVSITLSGTSSASTTTDASGNYTFANISAGTYTVTPSLTGYNYSPTSPSVTITNANQTQNITATSAVASYSISGVISYSGDANGIIYVGLKNADGSATGHGTSIMAPGPFVIRGVLPGTYYKLVAEMDIFYYGTLNMDNPYGEILSITVTSSNLTGQNITLSEAFSTLATPVTPTGLRVSSGDGIALIRWNNMTSGYRTIAESYKIYWGTDSDATNGTPIYVTSNYNSYIQTVANGTYYYKVSALAGGLESAASPVFGPVTIGAGTGGNTVSGTVTSPNIPTGPLYAGLYAGNGTYYLTKITSPSTSQSYSFAGVPNGTYKAFAFLDQSNNGAMDVNGDAIYDSYGALPVVINNNNPTVDLTLSSYRFRGYVSTMHWTNGSSSGYGLDFDANSIGEMIVRATVFSGRNIPLPLDIQKANNSVGAFHCLVNTGTSVPAVGDSYLFDVSHYSGNPEPMTASVTAVLDSFAQNLAATNTTIPTFSWSAPASPPSYYSYYIVVYNSAGNAIWYYPSNTPYGMPSTQTSVVYNTDGSAAVSSLTIGSNYSVYLIVMDRYMNSAWVGIGDTPTTAGSSGGGGGVIIGTGGGGVTIDYSDGIYVENSGSVQIYAH